jgi:hypothetical protein
MDQISAPSNNKMQQTSHGQDGGSLLILVLAGRSRRDHGLQTGGQ